ncbi:MAG: FkbM family methyltransferase [Planctomycetota bacterium]
MPTLKSRIGVAGEMVRDVGLFPTAKLVCNYARARLLERRRVRQFRRMKLDGPTPRTILGSRMTLDPGKAGLDRDLLLDGIREPAATGHLLGLLDAEDVVLEVGANIGYYALMEARVCRKVFAVEPHPENLSRLEEHVRLNGRDNIDTHHLALGSAPGTVPMFVSSLSNWHSCRESDRGRGGETIEVPCETIDRFASEYETPTVIKMDVEGFELEVLRGATETLPKCRVLFLEFHGDMLSRAEVRELLGIIARSGLSPSLVAQYDRPGMIKLHDAAHLDRIAAGDRGTYELFFVRS